MTKPTEMISNDLKKIWADFRQQRPDVRIRDAAKQLGVSEAELVATSCGENVTRLSADWGEVIKRLPELGYVMALTRNETAVHEKKGQYQNVKIQGKMGLVLDEAIDLRIFLNHWHYGFAVNEETPHGMRRSLQFFDADGTAIHKVFLTDRSNNDAFEKLVADFESPDQSTSQLVMLVPCPTPERLDDEVDVEGFRSAWRALQDTHDFYDLVKRFGITRTQALRVATRELAYQVPTSSLRYVLEKASADETPIMIFVGSLGVIQIHTGPVHKIKVVGQWLNVLDPEFNLHLREDLIASAWVVKKPTVDGVVTSLELYAANGENIALIFGKRKPGIPESETWRELVASIPSENMICSAYTNPPFLTNYREG